MKPSTQARAIAAYMAQRRAAWTCDGRRASDFPSFSAGQTSTLDYVVGFCGSGGCGHLDLAPLGTRAAPAPTSHPPPPTGAQADLTGDLP
jgi:hypothetical protein